MGLIDTDLLVKHKIINNIFDYKNYAIDENLIKTYKYFEDSFNALLESYSDVFSIKDCSFHMSNSSTCNAYASRIKGYSLIEITNAYPVILSKKFDKIHLEKTFLVALSHDKTMSDAFATLLDNKDFDISKFFIDCSIKFTFSHEFRHILQFKHDQKNNSYSLNENCTSGEFDIRKHIWEYDADRYACYEVLKHAFSVNRSLSIKSEEQLICLNYFATASIIISKLLFYYGIINNLNEDLTVSKTKFYIKEKSHPHPLVRSFNILDCIFMEVNVDLRSSKIDEMDLFINNLLITKLYFNSLLPNYNFINDIFDDFYIYIDDINDYNQELYDCAIKDRAIKGILKELNIKILDK